LRRVPWSPTFGLQRIDGPPCLHPRCVPFRPLLVLALVAPQSAQPRNVLRRFRQVSRAQVELRESVLELSAESAELVEQVIAGLNEACTSVKGTISGLQRQIRDPSEAELWISRGNALLQVTQQWYPGMTEVEAPDYSRLGDDGLPLSMTVELNPKKHFKENAKLCFKQASKITKAIEKCTPLLKAQEEELQRWKAELTKVEGLRQKIDAAAMRKLYEELCEQRYIRRPKPKKVEIKVEESKEMKWKRKYGKDVDRFLSPSGLEVLAGRSASANERVSFELTLKDALWFHTANGIPGSHVTIRAPASEVSEQDLEFAAAIAAWHSKAKDKLWAPVMYCNGHQLRKPARRRTGQVQVSGNYRQLDVRPALPEESPELSKSVCRVKS